MDWVKKHPIITGALVLSAFLFWRLKSASSSDTAEADANYSSGTTIVGTPNPLGGITTNSDTNALANSGFDNQLAEFFKSQTDQAKAAQVTAQTAALAVGNEDLLKTMLSRVGKGQDATFEYNELGQVTKIDADEQELPLLNPLQQAKQDAAIYGVKVAAAQKAVNSGVTNPYPEIQVTSKAQKQAQKQAAKLSTQAQTALAKAAALVQKAAGLSGKNATTAQNKAVALQTKAATLQAKAAAKLGQ